MNKEIIVLIFKVIGPDTPHTPLKMLSEDLVYDDILYILFIYFYFNFYLDTQNLSHFNPNPMSIPIPIPIFEMSVLSLQFIKYTQTPGTSL